MAFMTVQASGGGGDAADRLPVISYNAKAGRLFLLDRSQGADGTWSTNKVDVTMKQPAFAVDFPSLEIGWQYFPAGAAPVFIMVPFGAPLPQKPASPGNDDKGKAIQFKMGFRVKVVGSEIGGVRELAGNASTSIEGMNALHTIYEAAPEAAQGKIPLVKMTNVIPVKAGQSENFMPVYEVQRWVDRPAVLGAPPAKVEEPAPVAAAPKPTNHVAPPAAKQPAMVDDSEMPF